MSDEKEPTQIKLQVKIRDEVAPGKYANLTLIHHNDSEFVLDFLFVQPQVPRAEVTTRVIMSPRNFKRTIRLLEERMAHYEKLFGAVDIPQVPVPEGTYH